MSEFKKALVLGFPVAHSRSPLVHGYWLEKYGIPGSYEKRAVPPAELATTLRNLKTEGVAGCNLTVPLKEDALTLMDEYSAIAKQAGAVNTVVVRDDGTLYGDNTDVYGFRTNLAAAKAWHPKKPALVVGAGGAARAVLVALHQAGCKQIGLTNRTLDRARALVTAMAQVDIPVTLVAWEDRDVAVSDVGLVVNTTTQGMAGQPPLDLSLRELRAGALVTDLVYTPLFTPLLLEARRLQHAVQDGLGMLLHQAAPGFKAWFGVMPEVTPELRARVEVSLRSDEPA